ncbi:MAG: hypothetical protein SEPTF4163_005881 [Sporothrix epigloea]
MFDASYGADDDDSDFEDLPPFPVSEDFGDVESLDGIEAITTETDGGDDTTARVAGMAALEDDYEHAKMFFRVMEDQKALGNVEFVRIGLSDIVPKAVQWMREFNQMVRQRTMPSTWGRRIGTHILTVLYRWRPRAN